MLKANDILSFSKKYLAFLLVLFVAIIGLLTNQHYGIAWDEEFQRTMGLNTYNYLFNDDETLLNSSTRFYGVAIELPLILLEKITGVTSFNDIYYLRHIATHLYFLVGGFFCFILIDFLYQNKLLATIGFLLYILQPIIYCHSFFNSKDIPLLSTLMICFYLIATAFNKRRYWRFILLGIGIGFLTNIRLIGFMFFAIIPFFLIMDYLITPNTKRSDYKPVLLIVVFLTSACLTLYATWPILWIAPIENLKSAVASMSQFPWDGHVLINGELVHASKISWTYFFIYFGITNPLTYLVLGSSSILLIIYYVVKTPKQIIANPILKNNLIYLISFVVPIGIVLILRSVIYDGWRHLYFLYAPFILLIVFVLSKLSTSKMKTPVYVILFGTFIYIGVISIYYFPHQHVFFNRLVSHSPEYIRHHYDMDYWGTSYKQAIEYILENDSSKNISISFADDPGKTNLKAFESYNRTIIVLPEDSAKYHVTTYRMRLDDYDKFANKHFHSIYVNNSMINTIFKVK